nr:immunoglobulin light chain junction region [Macaca mulatta]MOX43395.1 immunoglobulin light chain junction region [Macaca mulatta]MOX44274.1 immunoglobulin light chain junction region [Macaca mulatta]MOX44774.1 immunoglobulin light chain junction region [Macaca mulatta]MOX44901.1 immunoglobulin light chain junction region [Macaca mulatta]
DYYCCSYTSGNTWVF